MDIHEALERPGFRDRFWARVHKTDGCWLWMGKTAHNGYGQVSVRHGHWGPRSYFYAHRVAYAVANGALPAEACVCHACDNHRCVRPDHLWLGTKEDNWNDMRRKGRNYKGGGNWGQTHGNAKLTEEDVRAIRKLGASGLTQKAIATQFGIDQTNVGLIIRRKAWRHIE